MFRFTTVPDFFREVENASRSGKDAICGQGISPQAFKQIEAERNRLLPRFRLGLYDPSAGAVLVTIPTAIHEELYGSLWDETIYQIYSMGLADEFFRVGHTTYRAAASAGGGSGEGDAGGRPISRLALSPSWPTIVFAGGFFPDPSRPAKENAMVVRWCLPSSLGAAINASSSRSGSRCLRRYRSRGRRERGPTPLSRPGPPNASRKLPSPSRQERTGGIMLCIRWLGPPCGLNSDFCSCGPRTLESGTSRLASGLCSGMLGRCG